MLRFVFHCLRWVVVVVVVVAVSSKQEEYGLAHAHEQPYSEVLLLDSLTP